MMHYTRLGQPYILFLYAVFQQMVYSGSCPTVVLVFVFQSTSSLSPSPSTSLLTSSPANLARNASLFSIKNLTSIHLKTAVIPPTSTNNAAALCHPYRYNGVCEAGHTRTCDHAEIA